MRHADNFNTELFNALHPATPRPTVTTPPEPVQAQLHLKRLDPKLRLAIDIEAKRRGQRLDELVPELLRLGLKVLRQGKAPGPEDRENYA